MNLRWLLFSATFFVSTFFASAQSQTESIMRAIPLGGNSWVSLPAVNGFETVSEKGWTNWKHKEAVWTTWLKVNKPGKLHVSARLKVPSGQSSIQWTLNGSSFTRSVGNAGWKDVPAGSWDIQQPGYVKIEARGLKRSGPVFAEVSDLLVSGSAVDSSTAYVPNNEGNFFYWGRRGPSVHINYGMTSLKEEAEWFYNEIIVPKGNDVIGSYFMANGFAEGYFGMQVNSATERRILFSVWSPFNTDDPKSIPDDKKILLLKKGENVHTGEFGNEGSGGQSYLKYFWHAGDTCRFLLHGVPVANNYTQYTAYFFDIQSRKWLLIAGFSRPATHTYLKHLHSFLENFEPETGNITRKAYYRNQWIRTKSGEWLPLDGMLFSGDATAKKGYRMDYAGGAENGNFFLQNCGFFNVPVKLSTLFTVPKPLQAPVIDFNTLQ